MDAPGDQELSNWTRSSLEIAINARSLLARETVVYFGKKPKTAGMLFRNYANMIINRNIDLFDDALFLLEANRLSSACIIARCIMETHAVGMFAWDEIEKTFKKEGLESAQKKILRFINSSRFKMEEQKGLKEGKFELKNFHFTEEAQARMLQEAAQSVHVLNAMRMLFEIELKQTGQKESRYEIIYNGLSEWVHPSQTSLFHKYAVETQRIETSLGAVSLSVRTKWECVQGLQLIQFSGNLHRDMTIFGKQLHEFETGVTS
jgi:hypothetical protein